MPNWCQNRFVVYGDKGKLLKFYMDMSNAISDNPNFKPHPNSWDKMWVGNMFLGAGYTEYEVEHEISCRGGIGEITLEDGYVVIDDETAWGPNDGDMQRMLNEKYPGLEMVFKCEEPGMAIYINTDTSGDYIPERFLLDCYSSGGSLDDRYEFYRDTEDLFRSLADLTGVSEQKILADLGDISINDFDWCEWVAKVKSIPEDEDYYIGVHEYESN